MLAVVQARVPPYSLFPPFIPFVGVNLRSQSRSQPSPLSLLLQWNCNEARITHNLLYIIMHIIPELEFLTFSINLFYISNFTRKRFTLRGPSEPPRNSLNFLPWVWHTYPQCFISTQGKNAIKNISSIQTKLERAWR